MSARLLPPALLALALLVPAAGAVARTHHRTATHHKSGHHAGGHHAATHHGAAHKAAQAHGAGKPSRHHEAGPAEHRVAAPGGAASVPGTGLKVFCPARKNPLLIRKATQGAGTTVTVVCR